MFVIELNSCDFFFRYQSQPVPLVSVEEVNQWVEDVTNGQIPNFLESIPHEVMLMLMNAVYFKGEPVNPKQFCMVVYMNMRQMFSFKLLMIPSCCVCQVNGRLNLTP